MRKWLTGLLAGWLVVPALAGLDPAAMNQVSRAWDRYAELSSQNKAESVDLLAASSRAHFGFLRDMALYADPIEARSRDWAAQAVYSYKVNPRTVVYAGASYGAFMDDDHPALFGDTRSVFLKLSYGFQP